MDKNKLNSIVNKVCFVVLMLLVVGLFSNNFRLSKIEKVMPTGQYANQTLATTCYVNEERNYMEERMISLYKENKRAEKIDKKKDEEVWRKFSYEYKIQKESDYDLFNIELKEQEEFFGNKKWKIVGKERNGDSCSYFLKRGKIRVNISSFDIKIAGEKAKIRPYLYFDKYGYSASFDSKKAYIRYSLE